MPLFWAGNIGDRIVETGSSMEGLRRAQPSTLGRVQDHNGGRHCNSLCIITIRQASHQIHDGSGGVAHLAGMQQLHVQEEGGLR